MGEPMPPEGEGRRHRGRSGGHRPGAEHSTGSRWAARATGLALIVLSAAVLLGQHRVRILEAHVSAAVQRLAGVDARTIGTAVIFPHGAHWIGLSLNAGCTSALLMIPFGVIAGGLLLGGRLTVQRGLLTVAAVIALVFAVNQVRIGIVALSMRAWGLQTGYERSHVLLGSLISTFGVAVGVVIFLISVSTPGRVALHHEAPVGAGGRGPRHWRRTRQPGDGTGAERGDPR